MQPVSQAIAGIYRAHALVQSQAERLHLQRRLAEVA